MIINERLGDWWDVVPAIIQAGSSIYSARASKSTALELQSREQAFQEQLQRNALLAMNNAGSGISSNTALIAAVVVAGVGLPLLLMSMGKKS